MTGVRRYILCIYIYYLSLFAFANILLVDDKNKVPARVELYRVYFAFEMCKWAKSKFKILFQGWHGILYLVSSSCSRRFEKEFTFEILFMRRHRNLNINCVNRNLESKHISLSTKILWGNCCGCLPRNGAAEHRRHVQDDVFSLGEPRALSSRHVEQSFQEPAAGCKH